MLKKKPFLAFSARKSKSAVFDFLHFQSLTAIENAWPSLASPGSASWKMALPGRADD
jgi:hypothetical protein